MDTRPTTLTARNLKNLRTPRYICAAAHHKFEIWLLVQCVTILASIMPGGNQIKFNLLDRLSASVLLPSYCKKKKGDSNSILYVYRIFFSKLVCCTSKLMDDRKSAIDVKKMCSMACKYTSSSGVVASKHHIVVQPWKELQIHLWVGQNREY
jgi:hypothetical protein